MRTVTNGPGEGRRAVIFKILLDPCFRLKSLAVRPALVLPRRLLVGSLYW